MPENLHIRFRQNKKYPMQLVLPTLLHSLQIDLERCDVAFANGDIDAAEYLNASIMLEERIDYLINEDIEYKGMDS